MDIALTYDYVKSFIESKGYQLLSASYNHNKAKLLLKCPIGHEHEIKFNNFKSGNRCPVCAGNIKYSYDYVKSFIESKGYTLLSDNYINNKAKLLLKCPIGHEYSTSFYNFRKYSCPYCINNNIKYDYDYVKSFIESEGYQLLSDNYKNNHTKLLLKCPIGHEYKVAFVNFKNKNNRCPICNAEKQSSKGEQDLALYVESLGIEIIKNDRSILVNPLTGKNLELDIYIPSLNKAIEYNGLYWHDKMIQQKRDIVKINQCKELNIDLLIVNEERWNSNQAIEMEMIKEWLKR